ncbi:hypothetical protein [Sorangium sp. So ce388]|uniref:hypothetical protein n=1 Tax=Sorangium sp. So ce388 TaxID=3133309 RepID=UPI003F5C1295
MNWRLWIGTAVGAGLTGAALRISGFSLWTVVIAAGAWYVAQRVLEEVYVLGPQRRDFILRTLAHRGEMRGLELVKDSDGLLRVWNVSRHMKRLERAGLVVSTPVAPGWPDTWRKYAITEKGRTAAEAEEQR